MAQETFDPQRFCRSLYELVVLGVLTERTLHGYQIALEVAEQSDGLFVLQHGTLYPVLHRLEKAKLVRSEWSEGERERRRRVYSLTGAGRKHLAAERIRSERIFRKFLDATRGGANGALRATS
jgi:DNA-binding PadR family transcriptional regulator